MGSNRQRRVSMEASSLSCIVTRASFVMAGEQSVNVGSHHARTEQARLLLTWPTVMVTFTSVEQVEVVVEAFTDATGGLDPRARRRCGAAGHRRRRGGAGPARVG